VPNHHGRTEEDLYLPAKQVGNRRRAAAIGHVHHIDAGHHFEQLAGHMWRAPGAGRRHMILRGSLGIGDELRKCLAGNDD
jgi:hypothetical protein